MAVCYTHSLDEAVARCRSCDTWYCQECLVYPFGAHKPPLCVSCALAVAGIGGQRRRARDGVLVRH